MSSYLKSIVEFNDQIASAGLIASGRLKVEDFV